MKKTKYVVALIFTSLVFFLGVLLGSRITSSHTDQLQAQIQGDILEMQGLELELSLVRGNGSSLCEYIDYRLPDIIRKKVELGRKFDIGDVPEEDAEMLKKQYIISLAKYWIFSEVNQRECKTNNPNIFFFFDDFETSREQGRILDYLVYRSNESMTIFAFNTMWDEPLVRLFMINNNITATPTIVIDNRKYEGVQSVENLGNIICEKYNMTFCGKL